MFKLDVLNKPHSTFKDWVLDNFELSELLFIYKHGPSALPKLKKYDDKLADVYFYYVEDMATLLSQDLPTKEVEWFDVIATIWLAIKKIANELTQDKALIYQLIIELTT